MHVLKERLVVGAALLQVGAGFVLAIGFGLIGFTTYQKLGTAFANHGLVCCLVLIVRNCAANGLTFWLVIS